MLGSLETWGEGATSDQPAAAPSAQRVIVAIEADIIEGRLKAGARLDEETLAARFGVSRTPVREALRVLATRGVIDLRPRQGAVVASPTMAEVIDLFELVAELEAVATRLSVERMGEDVARRAAIAAAHDACAQTAESGDPDAYFAMNARFHQAIHHGSRNPLLLRELQALDRRLTPYRRFITFRPERRQAALREHVDILDAIMAGDAVAAANAMRSHVRILGEDAITLATTLRFA